MSIVAACPPATKAAAACCCSCAASRRCRDAVRSVPTWQHTRPLTRVSKLTPNDPFLPLKRCTCMRRRAASAGELLFRLRVEGRAASAPQHADLHAGHLRLRARSPSTHPALQHTTPNFDNTRQDAKDAEIRRLEVRQAALPSMPTRRFACPISCSVLWCRPTNPTPFKPHRDYCRARVHPLFTFTIPPPCLKPT